MFSLLVLCVLLSICSVYFGIHYFNHPKAIQEDIVEGNITATGKGSVSIILSSKIEPTFVSVSFSDNFHSHLRHPCNPHNDWFEWDIADRDHCLYLLVNYDVGSIRTIHYKLEY